MDEKAFLLQEIRYSKRKQNVKKFLRYESTGIAAGGTIAMVLEGCAVFVPFYTVHVWAVLAVLCGAAAGGIYTVMKRCTMVQAAQQIDRFGFQERIVTAYGRIGKEGSIDRMQRSDAVESYYNKFGHEFILVDTAGLRKKTKVSEDLEFYSVMRAIRAIEHSDICILMIDAQYGVEAQDMAIFNLILKNSKGCVVAVNKWDLIENKTNNTMKEYAESIRKRLAPFSDIPVIFTSVIKKQRILDVLDSAARVWANYSRKIPTSTLNEVMLEEIENYPPPSTKGKFIKIKYITQLPTPCPSFAFFCNLPQYIGAPYKRFLENKLRSHFDFTGCPIRIFMRQK